MPSYVVTSESPIHSREIERPDLPGGTPEHPWVPGPGFPERPGHPIYPTLPPRDEWPPLPPWFEEHPGQPLPLPIPPRPEFPMVPVPPEVDPPTDVWPPVRPELPDLSGKSLALALIYLSRHVSVLRWVVIDHEEAKDAFQKLKDKLPAGGVGGTPPQRPTPGR